jgi:hypothetical protein
MFDIETLKWINKKAEERETQKLKELIRQLISEELDNKQGE